MQSSVPLYCFTVPVVLSSSIHSVCMEYLDDPLHLPNSAVHNRV